jgi:hypothetical protein
MMFGRACGSPSAVLLCVVLLAGCGGDGGPDKESEETPDASAVRGTWLISVPELEAGGSLELRVGAPIATHEAGKWLGAGCMGRGEGGLMAPAAVGMFEQSPGVYTATVTTTLQTGHATGEVSVAQLTGSIDLHGSEIDDDAAGGPEALVRWHDGEATGWSGAHVSLENAECPPVDVSGSGLSVTHNLEAHIDMREGERFESLFLVTETNIVSSGVLVNLPGSGTIALDADSDIFTPWVDFVATFRFNSAEEGLPLVGEPYGFVLLDAAGEPIAGTEGEDAFGRCEVSPPRGLALEVLADGSIRVTWNGPPLAFGFDPLSEIGMYQVQVVSLSGQVVTGAEALQAEHTLPWQSFGGEAPGMPDGTTYGSALEDLADGTYLVTVAAYANDENQPDASTACRVEDRDEAVTFAKAGDQISTG